MCSCSIGFDFTRGACQQVPRSPCREVPRLVSTVPEVGVQGCGMIRAMSATDSYTRTIRQAAHDAVRALLTTAPDSPEGSIALREVTAWLAHEHGAAAVLDLAEELAVDLAEALDAIAVVEQRDAVEVADRWFHDQPAPDVP